MDEKKVKFHFSGLCGVGMGNTAMLLKNAGHLIKGSDQNAFPPMSTTLEEANIPLHSPYAAERLQEVFQPDIQVLSNVLSKDHVEVVEGQRLGIPALSFPEVLGQYILADRPTIVISGTHGKTSTTACMAHLLDELNAGYLIGGVLQSGAPSCKLGDPNAPFVIEGDEYGSSYLDPRSKFLHYRANHLILTHLEWDHLDIFPSFDSMRKVFLELIHQLPQKGDLLYCRDAEECHNLILESQRPALSYGFSNKADYQILEQITDGSLQKIRLRTPDSETLEFECPFFTDEFVLNATGAMIMAHLRGLSWANLKVRMSQWQGVKRRLECLREGPGFQVYNDFAHHPTAVAGAVAGMKKRFPDKKIWAVFDPRNATSRRNVFQDRFSEALKPADRVILGPAFPDKRLQDKERLNVFDLARDIGTHAEGHGDEASLIQSFSKAIPEDVVVLLMSCGAFFNLSERLSQSSDGRLIS